MQTKRVPMRMCTGCGEMKSKKELVRIVKSKEGEISVDLTGKKAGRGAYVCRDVACLKKARKAKRIEWAFGSAIAPEVYERLEEELQADG